MSGHDTHDADERLTRLLELADGSRELPPGEEERLLAAMLSTASAPRPAADPDAVADLGGARSHEDEAARAHSRRSRRLAVLVAAASLVGAFVLLRGFLPTAPSTPTITSGVGIGDLSVVDTGTLCLEARERTTQLRLGDEAAVQSSTDVAPLEDLADVLDEFERRVSEGRLAAPSDDVLDRLERAPSVLRLQSRHIDNGDMDRAARTRARSTAILLEEPALLDAIGCSD